MRLLTIGSIVLLLCAAVYATQPTRDRVDLSPDDVRLEAVRPDGWRIQLAGRRDQAIVTHSFIAGRIRSFHRFYTWQSFLVGLGQTQSGGEAAWVWSLRDDCEAAGFMGFEMMPSPDGRYVAFQQFVARGGPSPGTGVVRVFDLGTARCWRGGTDVSGIPVSVIDAGTPVLRTIGTTDQRADFETRSPFVWVGQTLAFIVREVPAAELVLYRYDPSTARIGWKIVDWEPIFGHHVTGSPPDLHPTAGIAFRSMTPVEINDKPGLRLRVSEDYRHKVKWVDLELPDLRR